MSIENTYKNFLVEQFIQESLSHGVPVQTEKIGLYVDGLNRIDLSKPQFISADCFVGDKQSSSAIKFNNTFKTIRQDLGVLYEEMLRLSKVSIEANERWPIEAKALEKDLRDLEMRIDSLLFTAQDTDGYFDTVADNFTDMTLFDTSLSSCGIDLTNSLVHLRPLPDSSAWIDCNTLTEPDVKFRLRSTQNTQQFQGIKTSGTLFKIFRQSIDGWSTMISMVSSFKDPVVCEIIVHLPSNGATAINKIVMDQTSSDPATSSALQVTPLYSLDNINWSQLPGTTPTQEIRGNVAFTFPTIQAEWIKFILTKVGPDEITTNGNVFKFGFKSIKFAKNGFVKEATQSLISRPLWVTDKDGNAEIFNKLSLEVCEQIEDQTSINYFVTTSTDPLVPVTPSTVWVPIDPSNRTAVSSASKVIRVAEEGTAIDIASGTNGDINAVISFDSDATSGFVNPAADFWMVTTLGLFATSSITTRFIFANTNERILDFQLDPLLPINWRTLNVFRNVFPWHINSTPAPEIPAGGVWPNVRGIQAGWSFQDPYYSCVIQILNPNGLTINFGSAGNNPGIEIDGVVYKDVVSNKVLTGKTSSSTGIHHIKVHKDNWKNIPTDPEFPSYTDEATLKEVDPLYPYNHKHLLEGLFYATWNDTAPKVYTGVDLVAECMMREVSPSDMINNVPPDKYNLFAIDSDIPNSHYIGVANLPTFAFLVKIDEANPDFQNELFVIRFSQIGNEAQYLRLKAELSTKNENVSPSLHGYKIKVG